MEVVTECGYIPGYPIITPDSARELYVRGLGRNKICPFPGGLTKFHEDYMTPSEDVRNSGNDVGLVVQNTKPSIIDYTYPSKEMYKFYDWGKGTTSLYQNMWHMPMPIIKMFSRTTSDGVKRSITHTGPRLKS